MHIYFISRVFLWHCKIESYIHVLIFFNNKPKTGKEDLKELQRSIQMLAATPEEGNVDCKHYNIQCSINYIVFLLIKSVHYIK